MKYFYEIDDEAIREISDCNNGRFVIKMLSNPDDISSKEKKYQMTLMDKLGRISDINFDYITTETVMMDFFVDRRKDDCYKAIKGGKTFLIDKNLNILASDVKSATDFQDDISLVEHLDGNKEWVTRTGETYVPDYDDFSEIKNGFAVVSSNGKYHIANVKENFEKCSQDFDYIFGTSSDYYIGIYGDEYIVLGKNGENFKSVGTSFDRVDDVSRYGIVFKLLVGGKQKFMAYNLKGDLLFSGSSLNDYNSKIICFQDEGKTFYFNQETKKYVGKKSGYERGEEFYGNKCAVCLRTDERGEGEYAVLKDDGTMLKPRYEYIVMVDENQPAGWVPNKPNSENGKYYLLDETGNIYGKGYQRLGQFRCGYARFLGSKDRTSFVSKNGERFPLWFDGANEFQDDMTVTTIKGKTEVYDTSAINLKDISIFTKKIDNDPRAFLELPQSFYGDTWLIDEFYACAKKGLEVKFNTQNFKEKQEYFNLRIALKKKYDEISENSNVSKQKK